MYLWSTCEKQKSGKMQEVISYEIQKSNLGQNFIHLSIFIREHISNLTSLLATLEVVYKIEIEVAGSLQSPHVIRRPS